MKDTLENLYRTFGGYRIGDDFTGCECCVGPEHSARLAAPPVRTLTYDDLKFYSQKAISTWGNVRHFKHFLPRLLELSIEHRDDFMDLAVVFGKLKYADFDSWPQIEQDAVNQFFDEYWQYQLAEPTVYAFHDAIDTVLCAIARPLPSVQRFLDVWLATDTDNAKRHLAAFILNNDDTLLEKGRLCNSFWDITAKPHSEVINWLQSDAVFEYLEGPDNPALFGDFAYAWPQLTAIRAALSEERR